jgi:hypothetical protein
MGFFIVGGTILIAALNGAVPLLVIGAVTGGAAYLSVKTRMARHPRMVINNQRLVLEENIRQCDLNIRQCTLNGATPDELKAMKREFKAKLDELENVASQQDWGNKEMAAVAGVGGFACPVLGLVTIAAATSDKWLPWLKSVEVQSDDDWPKLS